MGGDGLEQRDEIVHEWQQVRQDDVVERAPEVELLADGVNEPEVRMAVAGLLEERLADVDADAFGRLERREQLTGAAADLEDRLPGGIWKRRICSTSR